MKTAYKKLPPEVNIFLKNKKISQQDILYIAQTDLDAEGRFADGYLVLTEKMLGMIQAPVTEGKAHYFRGSASTKGGKVSEDYMDYGDEDSADKDTTDWKAEFIPLAEYHRLWI